jgi:hypothetical protein
MNLSHWRMKSMPRSSRPTECWSAVSFLALTGRASDAVQTIAIGITALRATGATLEMPMYLSNLARAYAELGQINDACRCIGEALTVMETTKEKL